MDKERLKLIVKNLESLVEVLKSEIYSDVDSYKQESQYEQVAHFIEDYDEVFYEEEDDELFRSRINQKYKLTNDDDGDGL